MMSVEKPGEKNNAKVNRSDGSSGMKRQTFPQGGGERETNRMTGVRRSDYQLHARSMRGACPAELDGGGDRAGHALLIDPDKSLPREIVLRGIGEENQSVYAELLCATEQVMAEAAPDTRSLMAGSHNC